MATTFNNGESLASIRAKLNANAGEINGKANLSGGNTFSGNQNLNGPLNVNTQSSNLWGVVIGENRIRTGSNQTLFIQNDGGTSSTRFGVGTTSHTTSFENGNVDITSGNLTVNGQNWTSAWTSYTPAIVWSGGTTNPTMIDVQYYTKSIGKITFLNIWLFYSGGDRISATITIPTNVSSNGRQVLTTWSTRDNKPVFAFAFNNQNYLTISGFTQGAGNSEIYISGQLHIA